MKTSNTVNVFGVRLANKKPRYVECLEFVNADFIAGGLSPFAPERAAIHAGRLMLEQIHSLAERGVDFGFKTTLKRVP